MSWPRNTRDDYLSHSQLASFRGQAAASGSPLKALANEDARRLRYDGRGLRPVMSDFHAYACAHP